MTFYPIDGVTLGDLRGYTVILPAVSVGIVGCNTIDLLLVNTSNTPLAFQYVGCYDDPFALQSFTGRDLLATTQQEMTGQLHFSIEVFVNHTHQLLIIQQRSPTIRGRRKAFDKMYCRWLTQELQPQLIILLTSITSRHRNDIELQRKDLIQFFTIEKDYVDPPSEIKDGMVSSIDNDNLLTSPTMVPSQSQHFFPEMITPETPPEDVFQLPLTSVLHTQLGIPYTIHNQEHLENHHRVKQLGHYKILYSDYGKDGDVASSSSSSPKQDGKDQSHDNDDDNDNDDDDKTHKPLYFPFPIKGGGITSKLSKECRRLNIPLIGLTALTHAGDTRYVAEKMVKTLANVLTHIIPSLTTKQDDGDGHALHQIVNGDGNSIKRPYAWSQLYDEDNM